MADTHQLHCLFSIENDRETARLHRPAAGERVTPGVFMERLGRQPAAGRMEDHYRRAAAQMPTLIGGYQVRTMKLSVSGPPAEVIHPYFAVFCQPFGGLVACLSLALKGDVAHVASFMHQMVEGVQEIQLDDQSLRARTLEIGGGSLPYGIMVGRDIHHLLIVDTDEIPLFVPPGDSGLARHESSSPRHPNDVSHDMIAQLVFRSERPHRLSHTEMVFPLGINRWPGTVVAVGPYVTVMAPDPGEREGWTLWSLMQLTCCLSRLRQVREHVYEVLSQLGHLSPSSTRPNEVGANKEIDAGAAVDARHDLARLTTRLGGLELELAFGVEASLDLQFVLPSPMLAHYHRAAATSMGLMTGTKATSELLARASGAVGARRDVLSAWERAVDDVRVQRVTVVAGFLSVLAVISGFFFGFFGAAVSPVTESEVEFLDDQFLAFYGFLVLLLAFIALLFRTVRRRYPLREVAADPAD